ncbi:MAG: hypothetical protein V3U37_04475, partial [Nitrospinaceae bacterium]
FPALVLENRDIQHADLFFLYNLFARAITFGGVSVSGGRKNETYQKHEDDIDKCSHLLSFYWWSV